MPIVIGVMASLFVRSEAQLALLLRTFGFLFGLLSVMMAPLLLGLVDADDSGPVSVEYRSLSMTLVIVGCVLITRSVNALIVFNHWMGDLPVSLLYFG